MPTSSDAEGETSASMTAGEKAILACGIGIPWLVILYFCLPSIHLGLDNLSMMRYFDLDESFLIEYGMRMYQRVAIPIENTCGYPKLFNYICGLFLYPYTLAFGPSAKAVGLVYRSVNTAAMGITIVVINLIGIRFFRSHVVGAVSAILFAFTPEFLWWTVNSRPNPVELLFVAISLYFCLRALETQRTQHLWMAVFWAGLAAGTKLGGIMLIPTVVLLFAHHLRNSTVSPGGLRPRGFVDKATPLIVLGLGCAALCLVYFTLFFVTRQSTGLTVAQEQGWKRGMSGGPFLIGHVAGIALLGLGLFSLYVNRKAATGLEADRLGNGGQTPGSPVSYWCLFGYKLVLFSVQVSVAMLAVFLLANPDFLLFPVQNIQAMFKMSYVTVESTQFSRDSNYLVWLTFFARERCMGIVGSLVALYYVMMEIVQMRSRSQEGNRRGLSQRLTLASYVVVFVSFLVIAVQHRPSHYLLPVFLCLFVLGVDALVRTGQLIRQKVLARGFQVLCLVAVAGCVVERFPYLTQIRDSLRARESDPVVSEFAPWLSSAYSGDTKVMSDDILMYFPSTFRRLSYWKELLPAAGALQDIRLESYRSLSEEVPDVFVKSNGFSVIDTTLLSYRKEMAFLTENYSVVRSTPYRTDARVAGGKRAEIVVYQRNRRGQERDGARYD